MTKAGTVLGTASYMSPEQVRDSKAADVRNDIYGFGATFYHVCTGTAPHVGEDWLETLYKVRHEPLTSPIAHNPSIPLNLVRVLEIALAKKARDRFQTFEELKSQLEMIITEMINDRAIASRVPRRPEFSDGKLPPRTTTNADSSRDAASDAIKQYFNRSDVRDARRLSKDDGVSYRQRGSLASPDSASAPDFEKDAWYYERDDQPIGPIGLESLQGLLGQGMIDLSTRVWTKGMGDWVAAATVPELNLPESDLKESQPFSAEFDTLDDDEGYCLSEDSGPESCENDFATSQHDQVESRMFSEAPMTPESAPDPESPVARRRFANGKELQIVVGDIVEQGQTCEVIVSSDDGLLRMNAGVSNRIKQAAGIEVHEEAQRFAPVQAGRVVVTSAGKLPQRMIFHGITLARPISQMKGNYIPTTDLIRNILDSCCYHVESSQIKSIIFPLLGTGIAGMDAERCLETMVDYLVRELEEGITPLQEARIVIRPEGFDELRPVIERLL